VIGIVNLCWLCISPNGIWYSGCTMVLWVEGPGFTP